MSSPRPSKAAPPRQLKTAHATLAATTNPSSPSESFQPHQSPPSPTGGLLSPPLEARAEQGGTGGPGKILGAMLVVAAGVGGAVYGWIHSPLFVQRVILTVGWAGLAIITALQTLMMVLHILRPSRACARNPGARNPGTRSSTARNPGRLTEAGVTPTPVSVLWSR